MLDQPYYCKEKMNKRILMKEANLKEKYILTTAGGFFVLIIIGIVIGAIRLNYYI